MRKTVEFIVFGNNYRMRQFSASFGVSVICEDGDIKNPMELLSETEILSTDGWVALNSAAAINALVKDALGFASALIVLDALCAKIYVENFSFLDGWRPVEIPRRFISSVELKLENQKADPVISTVVMAGKATLKELEEYYSTEDAFKMYDMIAVDNLNKALGSEAAMAEMKAARK